MPADMLPLLQWLGSVAAPFIVGVIVGSLLSRKKPEEPWRDVAFVKLEDMAKTGVVTWRDRVYDCKVRPERLSTWVGIYPPAPPMPPEE